MPLGNRAYAVAGLALLVALMWHLLEMGLNLQPVFNDAQIAAWAPKLADPGLVLIEADADSQEQLGAHWWDNPEQQLALAQALRAAGVRAVVWWQAPPNPEALRRALAGVPVFFAAALRDDPWRNDFHLLQNGDGAPLFLADEDGRVRWVIPRVPILGGQELPHLLLTVGTALFPKQTPATSLPWHLGRPYAPISAWRLVHDTIPAAWLEQRIALIGNDVPNTLLPGSAQPYSELHVAALGLCAQAGNWHLRTLPWWLLLVLGALLALTQALCTHQRPPGLAALRHALLAVMVSVAACLSLRWFGLLLPLPSALVLLGTGAIAALGADIRRYQRELLDLLLHSGQADWLFGGEDGPPRYDATDMRLMLSLLGRALRAQALILVKQEKLNARVLALFAGSGSELENLTTLKPPTRGGAHVAAQLALPGSDAWWCLPLSSEQTVHGWLLAQPGEHFSARLAEDALVPLRAHLLSQVQGDAEEQHDQQQGLSQAWLQALTQKLTRVARRARDERAVVRQALDDMAQGFIVADGLGRCWLVNPATRKLLLEAGIDWTGRHLFTLLAQGSDSTLEVILEQLDPCYTQNQAVEIRLRGGLKARVTPAHGALQRRAQTAILPLWPGHVLVEIHRAHGEERSSDPRPLLAAVAEHPGLSDSQRLARLRVLLQRSQPAPATSAMSSHGRVALELGACPLDQLALQWEQELRQEAAAIPLTFTAHWPQGALVVLGEMGLLRHHVGVVLTRTLALAASGSKAELLHQLSTDAVQLTLRLAESLVPGPACAQGEEYEPDQAQEWERHYFPEQREALALVGVSLQVESQSEHNLQLHLRFALVAH